MTTTTDEIMALAMAFSDDYAAYLAFQNSDHKKAWDALRTAVERLVAERDALRSSLSRVSGNYRATLAGKPVRDVDECLSESDAALEGKP